MGFLDNVTGKGGGGIGQLMGQFGGQQSGLLGAAAKLLSSSDIGGIGGLMQMFQQKGLGDKVSSWVGTGENESISPDEVQGVLGPDRIRQVASDAGVSESDASSGLSSVLPQLVDKMTPDGNLPDSQSENQGLSQLASRFLGGS